MGVLKGQLSWGWGSRGCAYLFLSLFFSFRLLLRLLDLQGAETESEKSRGGGGAESNCVEGWSPAELRLGSWICSSLRPELPWLRGYSQAS